MVQIGSVRKVLFISVAVFGTLGLFFGLASVFSPVLAESTLFFSSQTPERTPSLQTLTLPEAPKASNLNFFPETLLSIVDGTALLSEMGPKGTIADIEEHNPDTRISLYVVRDGDTLQSIASLFKVSVNTIKWANTITGAIKPGDSLLILPITGVKHTVVKGDTIQKIANKYKADAQDVAQFNDLALTTDLEIGSILVVPEGEIAPPPVVPKKLPANYAKNPTSRVVGAGGPSLPGYFIRPVPGAKTQGIHGHNGVDFGVPVGTGVKAAAGGVVIASKIGGWNGGYGGLVIISHPNGTQTLYAHLSASLVSPGQKVDRGQYIGLSGNTGKSTGPHLHFEIRGAKNPF